MDTTFGTNIWQIGRPQKTTFNNAQSGVGVIITDTITPYPVNNHSVFTITKPVDWGLIYGLEMFQGAYYVQTDTLKDYGIMEFSPDNGNTWINMLDDTAYSANFIWQFNSKPVLTGDSRRWRMLDVLLADMGSVFNLQFGDTVAFRYTFISDSIYDNKDGLMYDELCFFSFVEGISEVHFKPIKSKIYPNPTSDRFTIEFENPSSEFFHLAIYDIQSCLMFMEDKISEGKIVLDAKLFKPGLYIYKLTNPKAQKRTWGKIIISE